MSPSCTALVFGLALLGSPPAQDPAPAANPVWKAGLARAVITPAQPTWMAGYAARTKPAQGKLHDLWAKALVLQDQAGKSTVLITLDLCGIDREFSMEIRRAIAQAQQLDLPAVVLACSHTHSGPVTGTNLISMYGLDDEQLQRVQEYSRWLVRAAIDLAAQAFQNLKPAHLSWEIGRADFAVNRRDNDQSRIPELRAQIDLKGPVDHDVPVLKIDDPLGNLRAVVCGYACHCTTLDGDQYSGDYSGFAMDELEQRHPGAQAMFWAGCGADANPLPRRSVELARKYGRDLADAVDQALRRGTRPIPASLAVAGLEIPLDFAPIPPRPRWEALARSDNKYEAARAKALLDRLDREGSLPQAYPYPITAWRLGSDVHWLFLGGEVVADYALRLKRNLGSATTWVAAYSNDVMAYIPSLRVLKEGGYEGGGAMVYYGQPAPWSEMVEDQVIEGIRQALKTLPAATAHHSPASAPAPAR
jgi:hypothetical protein